MTASRCGVCADTGTVCEEHPTLPWGGMCCTPPAEALCAHGACHCGWGTPCPACCTAPAPGAPIGDAFTPDWSRRFA